MTGIFYVPLRYNTGEEGGEERTPNKSQQHTKLTLEKKILLPLLPGFERTRNLSITSPALLPSSYLGSLLPNGHTDRAEAFS